MLDLRSLLGISLTDAKRLLDSIVPWNRAADQDRGWFVETAGKRGMTAKDAEERWQRLGNEVQRMRTRSAMFEKAYRCLKAAYLKAHYPEEFGAMGAAWRR